MKYMSLIFFIILQTLCLFSIPVFSQQNEDANTPITLEDYLRIAAMQNAGLETAFEQWQAALEQIPQAKVLPDPKFTYGYFIREIETRTGPQKQRFSIAQTFPWFGVIDSRTDIASMKAQAAYQNYEAKKLELFYNVKNSFYEYAYLGSAIDIAKQNVELLKYLEEIARTRYAISTGSHPDIIRAQIELAIIEDKLQSLEKLQEPMVAGLNSILNRKNDLPLPLPEFEKSIHVTINKKELIDSMISNNPKLLAQNFDIASAKAGIELAKKKFYPDLSIGLDWIQTDDAITAGVKDSGQDPIIAMFSINLPIWTESYKAAEIQARTQARVLSAKKEQSQNDFIAQFEKNLFEYEDSVRKISLNENTLIPRAQEMLEASETAYKAGTVDFLNLIDSQRTLLEFKLSYERECTRKMQKLAALEMLTGNEL
ncbi:MAG: TolC family protein [Sedimentisphaerales bacterium]|nr:TolC family protein [Sedimentisphaerales bacterium]